MNTHEREHTYKPKTRRSFISAITLGFFDNREISNESRAVGVLLDDPSGRDDLFTDLPEERVLAKYDKMRREDSELRALIRNVKLPIRAANYAIECEDDEVREFCERQVGIAEEDNNIDFQQFLVDALTYLDFGYVIFEYQSAIVDNRYLELTEISLRPVRTIQEFIMDRGRVSGVVQQTANRGEVTIDDNVMHMSFESEGNDPAGRSLLEPCVNDYDAKVELERLSQLHARRFAVGVPVIYFDEDKTSPSQEAKYEQTLKDYAAGNLAGLLLPNHAELSIAGIDGTGDRFDTLPKIQFHNQQMAKAFLSQLIELGTTQTGSRALGEADSTNFFNGIKAIADQICEKVTNDILVPLVEENFAGDIPVQLRATDVLPEDNSAQLDNIQKFLASKILGTNEEQREFIRELLELPPGDDSDMGGLQEQEYQREQAEQKREDANNNQQNNLQVVRRQQGNNDDDA